MDLQEIFMAFGRKVVPQAGKTEFRSACRRHGGATDPPIEEKKSETDTNNKHTPTDPYTHTYGYTYTHIHLHRYMDIEIKR